MSLVLALVPLSAGASDVSVSGKLVLGGGNVVISVNQPHHFGHHKTYKRKSHKSFGHRAHKRTLHPHRSVARGFSPLLRHEYADPHKPKHAKKKHKYAGSKYAPPGHRFYKKSKRKSLLHRKKNYGARLR